MCLFYGVMRLHYSVALLVVDSTRPFISWSDVGAGRLMSYSVKWRY